MTDVRKKNGSKKRKIIIRVFVAIGIVLLLAAAAVFYLAWSFQTGLSRKPSYDELVGFRKDDVLNERKDTLLLLRRQISSLGLEKVGVRNEMVTDICRVESDVYVLSPKLFKACQLQETVLVTSPRSVAETERLTAALLNKVSLKTELARSEDGCTRSTLTSTDRRSLLDGANIKVGALASCNIAYETSFSGGESYEWSIERIKSFNETQIRKDAFSRGEKSLVALTITITYFYEVMWR